MLMAVTKEASETLNLRHSQQYQSQSEVCFEVCFRTITVNALPKDSNSIHAI